MPDPMDAFESWLLQRVTQAVEAGEVSADLLTNLQTEMAAAREQTPDERHAVVFQELADLLDLPVDRFTELLAFLGTQPTGTRDLVLRRLVEAWLAQQAEAYRAGEHGD